MKSSVNHLFLGGGEVTIANLSMWGRAILISTSLSFAQCQAQDYEVEGTISYNVFYASQIKFACKKKFLVRVNECKWLISAEDLETRDSVAIGYEDGAAYKLSTFVRPTNAFAAVIESEEVPEGDDSALSYLWLAFASGCYFETATNNLVAPVWPLDDPALRYESFKVRAMWFSNPQLPRLPSQVTFYNDGYYRAIESVTRKRVTYPARAPYDKGYINAVYNVLEQTNVGQLMLPTKFEFTRYYIPPIQGTNLNAAVTMTNGQGDLIQLLVRSRILLSDAKCRPGKGSGSFRPHFNATMAYVDRRRAGSSLPVANVVKFITNGVWPEFNDTLLKKGNDKTRTSSK
jgi:hypothetical protein